MLKAAGEAGGACRSAWVKCGNLLMRVMLVIVLGFTSCLAVPSASATIKYRISLAGKMLD